MQAAGAALAAVAKKHPLKHLTILFPSADSSAAAQSFLSSFLSQLLYERTMLKSKKEPVHHLESVEVVLPGAGNQGGDLVQAAVAYARGVYLTRWVAGGGPQSCWEEGDWDSDSLNPWGKGGSDGLLSPCH